MKNPRCYARELDDCVKKMSGEHCVSENVLKLISGTPHAVTIETRGPDWLRNKSKQIGIGSLEANVLCQKHNSDLSPLDAFMGRLILKLDYIRDNDGKKEEFVFDGDNLERFFLKMIACGLAAQGKEVPRLWLDILFRGQTFTGASGLYVYSSTISEDKLHSREMFTWEEFDGGARVWFIILNVFLLQPEHADKQLGFTDVEHRPAHITFRDPGHGFHRLRFQWKNSPKTDGVNFDRRRATVT